MRTRSAPIVLSLPLMVATACVPGLDEDGQYCRLEEPAEIDSAAPRYQFVVDSIDLPSTPGEAGDYGLNLDGDSQGRPDNAIGQIFATLRDFLELDMDASVQPAIEQAQLLHLVEIQAQALDIADGVGVTVFLGRDLDSDPGDNFVGTEQFAADEGPDSEALSGFITDGRLEADLGTVPLRLTVPRVDGTVVVHLDAARIDASITDQGIDGVLAGVLSEDEMDATLFPAIHASVDAVIDRDCLAGECYPDSSGEVFLEQFDEDLDGAIGVEELRSNILIGALFYPDLDMLDADSEVRPRCDGEKESYSVGLRFTAVPARF